MIRLIGGGKLGAALAWLLLALPLRLCSQEEDIPPRPNGIFWDSLHLSSIIPSPLFQKEQYLLPDKHFPRLVSNKFRLKPFRGLLWRPHQRLLDQPARKPTGKTPDLFSSPTAATMLTPSPPYPYHAGTILLLCAEPPESTSLKIFQLWNSQIVDDIAGKSAESTYSSYFYLPVITIFALKYPPSTKYRVDNLLYLRELLTRRPLQRWLPLTGWRLSPGLSRVMIYMWLEKETVHPTQASLSMPRLL